MRFRAKCKRFRPKSFRFRPKFLRFWEKPDVDQHLVDFDQNLWISTEILDIVTKIFEIYFKIYDILTKSVRFCPKYLRIELNSFKCRSKSFRFSPISWFGPISMRLSQRFWSNFYIFSKYQRQYIFHPKTGGGEGGFVWNLWDDGEEGANLNVMIHIWPASHTNFPIW